jgi:hypothetical protein
MKFILKTHRGHYFYFYAVTIFTPDGNVLAFLYVRTSIHYAHFEWVTVA